MTCNNYLEIERTGNEHKRNRLERIAIEIVYGEYQRGMKKGNGVKPENYTEALDFIDLQTTFTEENFNTIMQKALRILYNVQENNNGKVRIRF